MKMKFNLKRFILDKELNQLGILDILLIWARFFSLTLDRI